MGKFRARCCRIARKLFCRKKKSSERPRDSSDESDSDSKSADKAIASTFKGIRAGFEQVDVDNVDSDKTKRDNADVAVRAEARKLDADKMDSGKVNPDDSGSGVERAGVDELGDEEMARGSDTMGPDRTKLGKEGQEGQHVSKLVHNFRDLISLPNEMVAMICEQIFDGGFGRDALSKLSQTCKRMNEIAILVLYRAIKAGDDRERNRPLPKLEIVSLLSTLCENSRLASL
ncbi:hypothetical protein B0T14DRAFT_581233 [Immersiella caudata]|uniref:Uncharacterized protein n=1 Tax=Immersiella caudata TaxID=314043 RepID=A0AA39WWD1_9PEZI|nr:hypothetical protein B0T14DRAFT_581233 [Immersiella caudata]